MHKCPDDELPHRVELRTEVREAKLELERLEALRDVPGPDLRGSNLQDMVQLTGSLAERMVKIGKDLDKLKH